MVLISILLLEVVDQFFVRPPTALGGCRAVWAPGAVRSTSVKRRDDFTQTPRLPSRSIQLRLPKVSDKERGPLAKAGLRPDNLIVVKSTDFG
jgi:hypothetical protein